MRKITLFNLLLLLLPSYALAQEHLYYLPLTPLQYVGLWLFLFGLAFMALELFLFTFGVAGSVGVIAFIAGVIILFGLPGAIYPLPWWVIAIICILIISFFIISFYVVIRSHRTKPVTGPEGLIGCPGLVISDHNEKLTVRVLGEIWEATSTHTLHAGDKIKVTHVKGLQLIVVPHELNRHDVLGK